MKGRLARLARTVGAPLAVRDRLERADAIVVLGAPLLPDGRISDIVAERARAAAALYHAGAAPIVCASGGVTAGAPRAEADAIAETLAERGVPASAIRVERASRTTAENARFTAELLAPEGVRSVWLVTQPFHGRRARWHFLRAGLAAHVWHIDDSVQYAQPRRALRWIAREYAAFAVNALGSLRGR